MADVYNQLDQLQCEPSTDSALHHDCESDNINIADNIESLDSCDVPVDSTADQQLSVNDTTGVQFNAQYLDDNFTLFANGQVLTDESGNVVGQINEDGTSYTLYSNFIQNGIRGHEYGAPDAESSITDTAEDNSMAVFDQTHSLPFQEYKEETQDRDTVCEDVTDNATSFTSMLSEHTNIQEIHQNAELEQSHFTHVETGPLSSSILDNGYENDVSQHVDHVSTSNQISETYTTSPLTKPAETISTEVLPSAVTNGAPLGSKENPIRIIQQGNKYSALQQLSDDQLKQVIKVLSQQQKQQQKDNPSSIQLTPRVIYCPTGEPNTQNVYELDTSPKTAVSVISTPAGQPYGGKKRGRKPKTVNVKKEDEETGGSELSKKEKEEIKRKKMKTRSGRISKPPKHMVQEYKHINLLDWDEDNDDSDGGYSDYKDTPASEDGDISRDIPAPPQEEINSNFTTVKKFHPRKFRCGYCTKSYIGRNGLDRHLKLFPAHTESDAPEVGLFKRPREKSIDTVNMESESRESAPVLEHLKSVKMSATMTPGSEPPKKRRKYGFNTKRKKLTELLNRCDDEVVLDAVLPRLFQFSSLYEILLMKCFLKLDQKRITFHTIFEEFTILQNQLQELMEKNMSTHQSEESSTEENEVQLVPEHISGLIGLPAGEYTFANYQPDTEVMCKYLQDQGVYIAPKQEDTSVVDDYTNQDSYMDENSVTGSGYEANNQSAITVDERPFHNIGVRSENSDGVKNESVDRNARDDGSDTHQGNVQDNAVHLGPTADTAISAHDKMVLVSGQHRDEHIGGSNDYEVLQCEPSVSAINADTDRDSGSSQVASEGVTNIDQNSYSDTSVGDHELIVQSVIENTAGDGEKQFETNSTHDKIGNEYGSELGTNSTHDNIGNEYESELVTNSTHNNIDNEYGCELVTNSTHDNVGNEYGSELVTNSTHDNVGNEYESELVEESCEGNSELNQIDSQFDETKTEHFSVDVQKNTVDDFHYRQNNDNEICNVALPAFENGVHSEYAVAGCSGATMLTTSHPSSHTLAIPEIPINTPATNILLSKNSDGTFSIQIIGQAHLSIQTIQDIISRIPLSSIPEGAHHMLTLR